MVYGWNWHFVLQKKPVPLVSQEGYCVALLRNLHI